MNNKLPPLPPSDSESLSKNTFDPYFRIGARDFWKGNHVEQIILKESKECDHRFQYTVDGVECKKCRIGWVGKELGVRDEALYVNNELVSL